MIMLTYRQYKEQRDQKIYEMAATMTAAEIAAASGLDRGYIYVLLRSKGIKAIRAKKHRPFAERNAAWLAAYENGTTATELADAAGLSRERVWQILRPHRVIEKRLERRRIVQEAMAEETQRLKDEAKSALEAALAPAVEMVRAGTSRRAAVIACGLDRNQERFLYARCRSLGLKLSHGRHQDFSARIAACEKLADAGLRTNQIIARLRAGGDRVHWAWVAKNLPHLRREGGAASSKPPKAKRELVVKPDVWTDECTALLREKWQQGLSAQHIADLLGPSFTRNSVIGKANRLRAAGQLLILEKAVENA